jgi:hypothetical protein
MTQHERFILEAVIVGLQSRRDKINRKIGELRARLDRVGLTTGPTETGHKRTISAVARNGDGSSAAKAMEGLQEKEPAVKEV